MHRVRFAILSDAFHMAREHRQNASQYLYLDLFTTKFVAIFLTLTQKSYLSDFKHRKSQTLRTAGRQMTN